MNYLFDTNACVALMQEHVTFRRRYEQVLVEGARIHLSSVVYFELFYGAMRSSRVEANRTRLLQLISTMTSVVPFEAHDAEAGARVRAMLEVSRNPIGHYDVLIAGQALVRGMTLVTANVREFSRVPGLAWEDWERGDISGTVTLMK